MQFKPKGTDSGVLRLLLQHLLEYSPSFRAVALQNQALKPLCSLPGKSATHRWLTNHKLTDNISTDQWVSDSGERYPVVEFPLLGRQPGVPIGRISLLLVPGTSCNPLTDLAGIEPLLTCIAGHCEIATELQAARQQGLRNASDFDFLSDLDRIQSQTNNLQRIDSTLEALGNHLECWLTALILPGDDVRAYWLVAQSKISKPANIEPLTDRLAEHTVAAGKVLVVDDRKVFSGLGLARADYQFLCSPILDSHSEPLGVLLAMKPGQFSRDSVRVVRAASLKLGISRYGDKPGAKLLKRTSMIERIDAHLHSSKEQSRAFMCIDIDRLHVVNERFGHEVGDAAIDAVINTVGELSPLGRHMSRLSGDLIGLYLPDGSEASTLSLAGRIGKRVSEITLPGIDRTLALSVSIGITLLPEHARSGSQALSFAEIALRSAKARGSSQCVVFGDQDASIMQRHSDLNSIGRLQNALIEDRFVIYAQEIRTLGVANEAAKYELLTRMLDDQDQIVSPIKFLSAAERYQMMPAFDRWVIARALRQLANAENMLEIGMSRFGINISAQSLSDRDFSSYVVERVLESGLPPDAICFELTESTAVRKLDFAMDFIASVKRIGCQVALDDFGAGYCSFGYLQDLDVDYIKIDGSFVRKIVTDPLAESIVRAVVGIAQVKNCQTIAEYAESDLILTHLQRLGVDYGQGFAIARPVPLEDVLASLDSPLDLGLTDVFSGSDIRELRRSS